MMHAPEIYRRASALQKRDVHQLLSEYADILKLHSGGKQSLMDVGTASGDILMEIIVPAAAPGFTRITGIDISPEMVEYSNKSYSNLEGVDFKVLDIETNQLPIEFHDQFDRVTSFFCLQWIRDQKKSLENIYNSLRKNGDCFLVFLVSTSTFDSYRALSSNPRWEVYTKELEKMTSPLVDHPQAEEEYQSLLEQVGFIDRRVEIKNKTFVLEGVANFKNNMKAINAFPLSDADYEDYFDALCDAVHSLGLREKIPDIEDYRFTVKYKLIVAYARKGE